MSPAQQGRAAVVYPDGIGRSWNAGGGCRGVAGAHGTADTPFVAAVVAASLRDLPIDIARVCLVGYSNGGTLAYAAECAQPPLPPVRTAVGSLRAQDCCTGAPTTQTAGASAVQRWTSCRPGSRVTFVLYPRSGHTWPGGLAARMWSFLTAAG